MYLSPFSACFREKFETQKYMKLESNFLRYWNLKYCRVLTKSKFLNFDRCLQLFLAIHFCTATLLKKLSSTIFRAIFRFLTAFVNLWPSNTLNDNFVLKKLSLKKKGYFFGHLLYKFICYFCK